MRKILRFRIIVILAEKICLKFETFLKRKIPKNAKIFP